MAKHTRNEFAKLCNLSSGNLANYIKRGKLNVINGEIDDKDKLNREFLLNRREFLEVKGEALEVGPDAVVTKKISKSDRVRAIAAKNTFELAPVNEDSLLRKKNQAAVDKTEIEIKLKQLQYDNLMGQNIPTDLVKTIIRQLGHSIINEYKSGMEGFLSELLQKKLVNQIQFSKFQGQIIEMINKAHENAIRAAQRSVKKIQEEKLSRQIEDDE